jgi:hypothetical protein
LFEAEILHPKMNVLALKEVRLMGQGACKDPAGKFRVVRRFGLKGGRLKRMLREDGHYGINCIVIGKD